MQQIITEQENLPDVEEPIKLIRIEDKLPVPIEQPTGAKSPPSNSPSKSIRSRR